MSDNKVSKEIVYTTVPDSPIITRNTECAWNTFKGATACAAGALYQTYYSYSKSWCGFSGVAITKRHVLFCQHWSGMTVEAPLGNVNKNVCGKFKFAGHNGEKYTAYVPDVEPYGKQLGNTDVRIVQLAEDLPDWVEIGTLASQEQYDHLIGPTGSSSKRYPVVSLPPRRHNFSRDLLRAYRSVDTILSDWGEPGAGRWSGMGNVSYYADTKRKDLYQSVYGGDSGTPQHLLVNGQLLVIGTTTYGGGGGGPILSGEHDRIQTIINELSEAHGLNADDYKLTISDLSTDALDQQFNQDYDYVTNPYGSPVIDITPSITPSLLPSPTPSPQPSPTSCPLPSSTPSVSCCIYQCACDTACCSTPSVCATSCCSTPSTSCHVCPSVTPSLSVCLSVTPSTSCHVCPSVTPSLSVLPSVTPSTSCHVCPSVTPSLSVLPSVTPSLSVYPSVTPSVTISQSPTSTPTPTPSASESRFNHAPISNPNNRPSVKTCSWLPKWLLKAIMALINKK